MKSHHILMSGRVEVDPSAPGRAFTTAAILEHFASSAFLQFLGIRTVYPTMKYTEETGTFAVAVRASVPNDTDYTGTARRMLSYILSQIPSSPARYITRAVIQVALADGSRATKFYRGL